MYNYVYISIVCFYQYANYDGGEMCTGIGSTNIDAIKALGLNDKFTSVRVSAGLGVRAYKHANFQGSTRAYTRDAHWLGWSFRNVISSFVVSKPEVCFYRHYNYRGTVMCAGTGGTDYPEIDAVDLNDKFSSVKVPSGFQVVAFEHPGYSGEARLYTGDVPKIGDGFNDVISSFILSEPQVCFFELSDFAGSVLCRGIGGADYSEINRRGLDNKFSSVIVPEGLRVNGFEDAGLSGRSKVFSETTSWVGEDFDDIISSFNVWRV